jgi:ATP-dependent Clp protease adaptor protein ClpS
MVGHSTDTKEEVLSQTRQEEQEPPMYQVLLHNDDYTTMNFVVELLTTVFGKSIQEATQIMLNIHRSGIGVCGIYTFEVAETKVETVHHLARERGFPLKSSFERAS